MNFLLLIFAAIIFRVYLILRDSVPFAYDMGRDLLWAKDISYYHIPTLIGPAASIWGIYFGPFWYYFLSIPLFLSGGNPLSAVYATFATIVSTGLLAYFLFKKYLTKQYALIFLTIILFSAALINISTFAFHANVLPLLTLVTVYLSFLSVVKNPLFLAAGFLSVSLMFHDDPAPAVVFTSVPVFIFLYFKLYKTKELLKLITLSVFGYIAPFAPQIFFEIRHNFLETKSLVAYFQGKNPSLSGQLPLVPRIVSRLDLYFEFFKSGFAQNNFFACLFLIIIIIGTFLFLKTNKDKKLSVLFKINLYSFILTFLIFTIFVTVEIKNWYLYGVTVLFAFLIVFALYGVRSYKFVLPLFLTTYVFLNILPFFKKERIVISRSDPAQLTNQLSALNLIYSDSANLPFSVYTFTPSIYDYNYQYLFWWQGIKLGRGQPEDFAYLPNVPDYVRNKGIYAKNTKPTDTIYLIIEKGKENEFYTKENWLKNFDRYRLIWEKNIGNAVIVQKRQK